MRIFFKILAGISMVVTIASLVIYFIYFDKGNEKLLYIDRGFIFAGIALLMVSYQYDFRHDILPQNKQKTGRVVLVMCLLLSVIFVILSVIQFVNAFK